MLDCLDATETPVQDRHIAQPVHSPSFWPAWLLGKGAVRAITPSELLADVSRLVVVAPHPDDEVLMCAGLIQSALAQGIALAIVAVTDGEACFGPDAHLESVAAVRRAEAHAGLRALGAGSAPVHRLSIPDGDVLAHEEQVQFAIEALLRPGDVVVTPWRLDGHPDHDATGRVAAAACMRIGCPLLEAPVWMWHWATPHHPAICWERLCISPLSPASSGCKAQALACHASQLAPHGEHTAVVDDALQQRTQWPFESFFLP